MSKKTGENKCPNTAAANAERVPPLMLQQWQSDASLGGSTPKLETAVLQLDDSVKVAVVNMKPEELEGWMQNYEVEELSSDEEADYATLNLQAQKDEHSLDVQEFEFIDMDMSDLNLIISNDAHSPRDHGSALFQ